MPSPPRHPLERPLSPRERASLWRFLEQVLVPAGGLGPESLDGFLMALVIGPDLVPPSRYLPLVKGRHDFQTLEEAQNFMTLLLKRWNHLALSFVDGRMPKLWLLDARPAHKGTAWCRGFLEASKLWNGGWAAVQRNPALKPFLPGIEALGGLAPAVPMSARDRKGTLSLLGDDLRNLHAAWLAARSPRKGKLHGDAIRL